MGKKKSSLNKSAILDPVEAKMKIEIDEKDAAHDKEIKAQKDELAKIGNFKKIFGYIEPKWMTFFIVVCSAIVGAAMPSIGLVLS